MYENIICIYLFPILPSSIISSTISARIISCRISFRCRFPQPRTKNRLEVKNTFMTFCRSFFTCSFLLPLALYLQDTRTCHFAVFCMAFPTFWHVHLPLCTVFATWFGMFPSNFARYLLCFRHFNLSLSFCMVLLHWFKT